MSKYWYHIALLVLLHLPTGIHGQGLPVLPRLDSLHRSVDRFYSLLTHAQSIELQEQRKSRWLDYLPSPGYSPFQGGFTLSMNLTAPLSELKGARLQRLKLQSIHRTNEIQAADLKRAVTADFLALQNAINECKAKDSLEYVKLRAYNLFSSQYQRNEMAPSEYLAKQQDWQSFQVQRLSERNAIQHSFFLLLAKAKITAPPRNENP